MFENLNKELQEAQERLEKAIREVQEATKGCEVAKIVLIQSESAYKKAKLEVKLYDERVKRACEKVCGIIGRRVD